MIKLLLFVITVVKVSKLTLNLLNKCSVHDIR
jgi:hypothetical protein